jgi:hypothetical protein
MCIRLIKIRPRWPCFFLRSLAISITAVSLHATQLQGCSTTAAHVLWDAIKLLSQVDCRLGEHGSLENKAPLLVAGRPSVDVVLRVGVTVRTSDQLTDRLKRRLLRRILRFLGSMGAGLSRVLIKNISRHPAQVARGVSVHARPQNFAGVGDKTQAAFRHIHTAPCCDLQSIISKAMEAHLCPSSVTASDVAPQPARLV